jgi:hypothetical protein
MIFVPRKDGISQNEAASIAQEGVGAGARVLAEAMFGIAM